jgi:PAS domain S-box-containing protein
MASRRARCSLRCERNLRCPCLTLARAVQILPATMSSLPSLLSLSAPAVPVNASCIAASGIENEGFLLRAFSSFAEAATSLEQSYGLLRSEVFRLRHELEQSSEGLAQSVEENRRMREHLDRILEGLPCGVLVANEAGEIWRLNPEGRRLLGWQNSLAPDSALSAAPLGNSSSGGEYISILRPGLRDLLDSARDTGQEQEARVDDSNGEDRWLAVRHAVVPDRTSQSSVFILQDVSGRKQLEQAQAKSRREQALAEMSAVLAHEVRNPLGSLELFAGLLAEAELSPECRRWIDHLQCGLRALAATVSNVLHFHSLPQPERIPLDLGELLDWARDFLAPLARRAHVEISLHNRLQNVLFAGDRHRLEQVLLNLVLNALRAMPGGGWIKLAGHQDPASIVIVISDTGPGIAPEHLKNIFEPGFSTRAGSPGLGLAVCRKIVEQHGGSIEATSPPGAGASFILKFSPTLPNSSKDQA